MSAQRTAALRELLAQSPTAATTALLHALEQILTAVSEGVSRQASWRLAKLKKERMAKDAEKLLVESMWLPVPLRVLESVQKVAE